MLYWSDGPTLPKGIYKPGQFSVTTSIQPISLNVKGKMDSVVNKRGVQPFTNYDNIYHMYKFNLETHEMNLVGNTWTSNVSKMINVPKVSFNIEIDDVKIKE
jgi:hypothetical protein